MRRHESPEGAVLEELAEGDGVSLVAGGLLGLARLLLLGGLASIDGFVVHVADRPPGTPDETEDAEEVEDGGPAAKEEDDGGRDDEAGEGSHVEATEGGGHSLGALGAGDALGENASGRGGRDTLAETDEEAGDEERGEGEVGARGRNEGTKGPEHHAGEEHELATVLGGEPAARNLGEGVTPEEGGLDETLLDGGPAEALGHGHNRDGHVHLVKVAEHEGAEQGENHGPALLLATLGHVEADVLGDGVGNDGTTTTGGDHLGVTALGLHDGRGARDGGDLGDTHAHGRFAGDLNSRNRGGADGANGTARGGAGTGEHGSLSRHSRHDEGHFSPTCCRSGVGCCGVIS